MSIATAGTVVGGLPAEASGARPVLLRRYNGLIFLSALLSVSAFLAADDKGYFLPPAYAIVAGAWWASRRAREAGERWALPPLVINLLVFAVIVNAALRTVAGTSGEPVVSTLGGFLTFVLLIKTYDRRSARDDAQLLTLSVFVVLAALLTSNTLVVGVCVALFTITGVSSAMLWQVQAGDERSRGATALRPTTGGRPTARDRAGVRAFRLLCAGAILSSAVLAAIVFVFTPRGIGGEALGRFGMTREKQIGFREEVRLGEAGLLSPNPTPVMDVSVAMPDGTNAGSSQQVLYLRGGARDKYNSEIRTWEDSTPIPGQSTVQVDASSRWIIPPNELDPGGIGAQSSVHDSAQASTVRVTTVNMRSAPTGGNLFCLWRPVDVLSDQRLYLSHSPMNRTMRRIEGASARISYTTRSVIAERPSRRPPFEFGFQEGPIRDLTVGLLTEKGLNGPDLSGSRTAVAAIRDYLRSMGTYTTEMIAPPAGEDAIEFFLFTSKRGHCEYFASAMAAMCQSIGVPARVAVGYVATEYNPLSGQYLVRESNAHAWVEAFVISDPASGQGRWETFDPSPPGDIERIHRPDSGWFASVRGWYESLEFRWSSSIVGFDTIRQGRLFGRDPTDRGSTATEIDSLADRMARWMRRSGSRRAERERASAIARVVDQATPWVIGAGVVGALGYAGYKWKRRGSVSRPANRAVDAEMALLLKRAGFYPRALGLLERFGRGKPRGAPPLEHARRLALGNTDLAKTLHELGELYYAVRFGRRPLTDDDIARGRALVASLEALLRGAS